MAQKLETATIVDFETSFDTQPVLSPEGEVVWADLRIDYILAGLTPTVTIRVPVPWDSRESVETRKSKALRCARELIDHACQASGAVAGEPAKTRSKGVIDDIAPALEGIAQELGLTKPTTCPRQPAD